MALQPDTYLRISRAAAAIVVTAVLCFLWASRISPARLETDAQQSTWMAVNFAHHGTMSLDDCEACRDRWVRTSPWALGQPYRPTNYREPVPILVTALAVRIVDRLLGPDSPEAYLDGPRARLLKYQNLLWMSLLSFGAFVALRSLAAPTWLAMVAVVVVNVPLLRHPIGGIDDLRTEIPATALLLLASWALVLAHARRQLAWFAFAGFLFGIAALIKATVLYIVLAMCVGMPPLLAVCHAVPWRLSARWAAVMAVGCALVVFPWMLRDHLTLGTWQIAQRGGVTLWERALEDQVSRQEYFGAIYLWAPNETVQRWLGRRLELSTADIERGGRLQRLNSEFSSPLSRSDRDGPVYAGNPEHAVTLYRQAEAERTKQQRAFAAAGHPHPDVAADASMFRGAMSWIIRHPGRHLALSAAVLWRGGATAFTLLLLAMIVAMRCRSEALMLFALPSLTLVILYAVTSPFFPRYGEPARLIAHLCVLAAIAVLLPLGRYRFPAADGWASPVEDDPFFG